MYKIVLMRHGESTWNLENRFTGWTDVDLTPLGVQQAQQAGLELPVQRSQRLRRAAPGRGEDIGEGWPPGVAHG